MIQFKDRIWSMKLALEEASKAYDYDEVPVGACIIDNSGKVVARSHNTKEREQDPCGHAEINVIKKLSKEKESWRLKDCHIIVTLEPCVMCMGAIISSRLKSLTFGAYDPKGGFLSLGLNIHKNKKLNHEVDIFTGVRQHDCSKILSQFFKEKRQSYKFKK